MSFSVDTVGIVLFYNQTFCFFNSNYRFLNKLYPAAYMNYVVQIVLNQAPFQNTVHLKYMYSSVMATIFVTVHCCVGLCVTFVDAECFHKILVALCGGCVQLE